MKTKYVKFNPINYPATIEDYKPEDYWNPEKQILLLYKSKQDNFYKINLYRFITEKSFFSEKIFIKENHPLKTLFCKVSLTNNTVDISAFYRINFSYVNHDCNLSLADIDVTVLNSKTFEFIHNFKIKKEINLNIQIIDNIVNTNQLTNFFEDNINKIYKMYQGVLIFA